MFKKQFLFIVILLGVGVGVLAFTPGDPATSSKGDPTTQSSNPVGTYIVTVTAGGAPPFKEMITLHADGTLSETNTTLHPNSANAFFPFNGSDGYGIWSRGPHKTVELKIIKVVFDADNAHIGYLVVEAIALIDGDDFTNLESDVNILLGPDLFNPFDIIPLGPTDAVGRRITLD